MSRKAKNKIDTVVDQNQWQRVATKGKSVKQLSTRANNDDNMITGCTYYLQLLPTLLHISLAVSISIYYLFFQAHGRKTILK